MKNVQNKAAVHNENYILCHTQTLLHWAVSYKTLIKVQFELQVKLNSLQNHWFRLAIPTFKQICSADTLVHCPMYNSSACCIVTNSAFSAQHSTLTTISFNTMYNTSFSHDYQKKIQIWKNCSLQTVSNHPQFLLDCICLGGLKYWVGCWFYECCLDYWLSYISHCAHACQSWTSYVGPSSSCLLCWFLFYIPPTWHVNFKHIYSHFLETHLNCVLVDNLLVEITWLYFLIQQYLINNYMSLSDWHIKHVPWATRVTKIPRWWFLTVNAILLKSLFQISIDSIYE